MDLVLHYRKHVLRKSVGRLGREAVRLLSGRGMTMGSGKYRPGTMPPTKAQAQMDENLIYDLFLRNRIPPKEARGYINEIKAIRRSSGAIGGGDRTEYMRLMSEINNKYNLGDIDALPASLNWR